jgi:ribonuclease P protein component
VRPQGFPRRFRVSRRREFLRAQRTGRKLHTRHFLVFVLVRGDVSDADGTSCGVARLGITVTRKVAKAVGRNRIKRLVREVFRRERGALPGGIDLVWVAKRDASSASFSDVSEQMREIVGRVGRVGRSGFGTGTGRTGTGRTGTGRTGTGRGSGTGTGMGTGTEDASDAFASGASLLNPHTPPAGQRRE